MIAQPNRVRRVTLTGRWYAALVSGMTPLLIRMQYVRPGRDRPEGYTRWREL